MTEDELSEYMISVRHTLKTGWKLGVWFSPPEAGKVLDFEMDGMEGKGFVDTCCAKIVKLWNSGHPPLPGDVIRTRGVSATVDYREFDIDTELIEYYLKDFQ